MKSINTLSERILLKYVVRVDYVLCLNSVIKGSTIIFQIKEYNPQQLECYVVHP